MTELVKVEHWTFVNIVHIEDDRDVNRVLEFAREYAQSMGFGEVETTIFFRSISELSKNILDHSAEGTVGIRAISLGSKKRMTFVFFNYLLRGEEVHSRLWDNVSENGRVRMGLSEKGEMPDEIEIESEPEDVTTIQIRKRL